MVKLITSNGAPIQLGARIGGGHEAEVFEVTHGTSSQQRLAAKLYRFPDNEEYKGDLSSQKSAERRISQCAGKLKQLMNTDLPPEVIKPVDLLMLAEPYESAAGKVAAGYVVGFLMPLVSDAKPATSLRILRDRKELNISLTQVKQIFLRIHEVLQDITAKGVVPGDLSDANLLVRGKEIFFIDVDSWSLPGFPSGVFTDRYLAPWVVKRRMENNGSFSFQQDEDTLWYAYASLLFEALLVCGPFDSPALGDEDAELAFNRRRVAGTTVFHADATYPTFALDPEILPEPLFAELKRRVAGEVRGVFPKELLVGFSPRACDKCKLEHSRLRCPADGCGALSVKAPAVPHADNSKAGWREYARAGTEMLAVATWGKPAGKQKFSILSKQDGVITLHTKKQSVPLVKQASWVEAVSLVGSEEVVIFGRETLIRLDYDGGLRESMGCNLVRGQDGKPMLGSNQSAFFYVSGATLFRGGKRVTRVGTVANAKRLWVGQSLVATAVNQGGELVLRLFDASNGASTNGKTFRSGVKWSEVAEVECYLSTNVAWLLIRCKGSSAVDKVFVINKAGEPISHAPLNGEAMVIKDLLGHVAAEEPTDGSYRSGDEAVLCRLYSFGGERVERFGVFDSGIAVDCVYPNIKTLPDDVAICVNGDNLCAISDKSIRQFEQA